MNTCRTGKRVFVTEQLAEEALIAAHGFYSYAKGKGPVGVYACEECGHFHLTSKGEVNPRLAAALKSGDLRREQQASQWLHKVKKRRS